MITKVYSQDLSAKNTFGMKVSCRVWMEYDSVADLFDMDFEQMHKPVKHIGAGSNLLFTQDFKGTILHSKINFIEVLSSMKDSSDPEAVFVSVGAGVVFDDFCAWAASKGLWGVENLSHIPGEVGASAVQNIGAYGVEACDVIKTVYAYDIEEEDFVRFDVSECGYGYRESMFKKPQNAGRYIITHVLFRLTKEYSPRLDYGHVKEALPAGAPVTPALVRDSIVAIRKNKLPEPERLGSAGSFFKNPVVQRSVYEAIASKSPVEVPHYDLPGDLVKIPAAWLIEQCGWKGRRSGNAAVYDKQPLVIVNATGQALPEEIISLESKIRVSVRERFGIELSAEVEHI